MTTSYNNSKATQKAETYLDRNQLAALLRVTRRTIDLWHMRGNNPPYLRVGRRKVLYRRSDVEAWLDRRAVRSLAEERTRAA
jgi:predicted DNA-binding transcriptional regulator AlpA